MVALAHNVLKMVRRQGSGVGSPGPVAPADDIAASGGNAAYDAVANFVAPLWCFAWVSWWTFYFKPALRSIDCQFGNFLNRPGILGHRGCHTPAMLARLFLPTLTSGSFQNLFAPLYCRYVYQTRDRCDGATCLILLLASKSSNRSGPFWTNPFQIGRSTQDFPWVVSCLK